ncbi:XPB/Ssl2-like helicase family protein [Haloactinospora alba]|uniref:XPB/Ssl2-like helicase family protein n=1 Tax=Haloactinospora alba TaxID=405555 RepID=A0A543N749_9ACTN|nr:helicase-associated domain-containing protein [Haloactinospora alba]TQN27654.1 XPB/Ssl2-like helicase family protein [Haloactinospora alba]
MTDDATAGRAAGRPCGFTSWLRALPDTDIAELFAARPDLGTPVPADMADLADRASARPSVTRLLDRLDRFSLQVLEGVAALGDGRGTGEPGTAPEELAAALGTDPAPVRRALEPLRRAALVWEDSHRLHPLPGLTEILAPPAGLGPPLRVLLGDLPTSRLEGIAAATGLDPATAGTGEDGSELAERLAAHVGAPDRIGSLLADAGDDARPVVDRLVWGPPHGTLTGATRDIDPSPHASPIARLLARALLVPLDDTTVALPREVGLFLREGHLFHQAASEPPALDGPARSPAAATQAAAGQAFAVLRAVEELLEQWAHDPPGVLRNGGLGVRDVRHAAQTLELEEPDAALLIETARAAGLIATDGGVSGAWLPAPGYDLWRRTPPERRWLRLAEAWLHSTRVPALSGSKDERGRTRNVLGEGLDRRLAPEVRFDVLTALAATAEGTAPRHDSVTAYLEWLRPRRQGEAYGELAEAALREATVLGFTGRGALAPHARALLEEAAGGDTRTADREDSRAAAELAAELPRPSSEVLVQGDLTAVAPGPLVPELARELALAADVESTGGATVYRFTTESVRRALDAGRDAEELTGFLERHSRTPLPQPLRYLISDTARKHGRLRAGTASSYLRCDDPALLDELTHDTRTGDLVLIRLAPTVVASRSTRPVLLERLTSLGYHPVAETTEGSVQLSRSEGQRASESPTGSGLEGPTVPDPKLREAAARAVRAGDTAASAGSASGARPETTLSELAEAAEHGRQVWIGYLGSDGRRSSRIVEPSRVDGGYLTAYDATRAAVHRFAVQRITGVADLDAAGATA